MTISRHHAAGMLFGVCVAPFALAAEQSVNAVVAGERAPVMISNGSFFSMQGNGDPSRQWQEMQRKLADPSERAAMVVASRARMPEQFPDFAEVLRVSPAIRDKFFDWNAEQEIATQAQMYSRRPDDPAAFMQDYTGEANAKKEQIRALLGDAAFDRYLGYEATRMERMQVAQFNAGLGAAEQLSMDQKERMILLVQDRMNRVMLNYRIMMNPRSRMDLQKMMRMSPQERAAENLRRNIEANEEAVRAMRVEKTEMVEKARPILTPVQLTAYGKYYDGRIDTIRRSVQDMRVKAGMSPDFDDQSPPKPQPPEPERYAGKVQMKLSMRVDEQEPLDFDLVTDNGKAPAAFTIGDNIWVEATPVLYADRGGTVTLQYYEERHGKRIPLRGRHFVNVVPESVAQFGMGGGSGGGIDGSRMHNVMVDARVSPAQ